MEELIAIVTELEKRFLAWGNAKRKEEFDEVVRRDLMLEFMIQVYDVRRPPRGVMGD